MSLIWITVYIYESEQENKNLYLFGMLNYPEMISPKIPAFFFFFFYCKCLAFNRFILLDTFTRLQSVVFWYKDQLLDVISWRKWAFFFLMKPWALDVVIDKWYHATIQAFYLCWKVLFCLHDCCVINWKIKIAMRSAPSVYSWCAMPGAVFLMTESVYDLFMQTDRQCWLVCFTSWMS